MNLFVGFGAGAAGGYGSKPNGKCNFIILSYCVYSSCITASLLNFLHFITIPGFGAAAAGGYTNGGGAKPGKCYFVY